MAAQQRFRRQQATPPPAPTSYPSDSTVRLAPAPYAPMAALQPYPAGPRGPGAAAPLHPTMGGPQFVAGSAMPMPSGGVRGTGGPPMRRPPPSAGYQPQHQPQQMQLQQPHQGYGAGGQPAFSMQEYAAGPTAMVSAYGMGELSGMDASCTCPSAKRVAPQSVPWHILLRYGCLVVVLARLSCQKETLCDELPSCWLRLSP